MRAAGSAVAAFKLKSLVKLFLALNLKELLLLFPSPLTFVLSMAILLRKFKGRTSGMSMPVELNYCLQDYAPVESLGLPETRCLLRK